MADQIVNDFTLAIRDLETPRDHEVAVRVGNDRKIIITGFSALLVKDLLKVCDESGKRFKIPVPAPDATSIQIHVDDKILNDDDTTFIDASTPDILSQSLKQKWGWQERQRVESGSVMLIRFIPCVTTTSDMFEKIMKNQSILNVELTPNGWNIQFVIKRNWSMSLSELSKRKPHYFSKNTACKKRKSRFRRSHSKFT